MNNIILFDGYCNFCDRSVLFIIKRDPEKLYKFASLQSETGISLLKQYNVPKNIESLVLISNNTWYSQSSAALRISKELTGVWKFFYIFIIIPKTIRDLVYQIIAKNRYKWFGKKDSCELPNADFRNRFYK